MTDSSLLARPSGSQEIVDGRYATTTRLGQGDLLVPRAFPDVRIPVDELLPGAKPGS